MPLAGIVAIGVLSFGGQTRASLLWVFPIAWIATYYRVPALGAALGLIGVFLTVDAFVGDMQPALVQRAVIVLLCLGFMGVTISVGSRRNRAFSRLLRRQFAQLDRTRRRAEQQTRRTSILANSLDIGIARVDRDGVLLDANRFFLELFDAASLTEFTPTGAVEYDGYRGDPVGLGETFLARAAGDECKDRRASACAATREGRRRPDCGGFRSWGSWWRRPSRWACSPRRRPFSPRCAWCSGCRRCSPH